MSSPAAPPVQRIENLALLFQEPLTVIERLRCNRQRVSDSGAFRQQMRNALATAAQQARNPGGYSAEDIKMSTFAVVGFLDESILNSQNAIFGDWPRKPLQEELFGTHMAGEVFFQNLEKLLVREDSRDLADVLEVHYLCLLLGFRGRYSAGSTGDLRTLMKATGEKIGRIRGEHTQLSPAWKLPGGETRRTPKDTLTRRLGVMALILLVLTVALFTSFKLSLSAGSAKIQAQEIR